MSAKSPQYLEQDYLTTFEKDGYVVLRDFFSEPALEVMRQSLRDVFAIYSKEGEDVFATVQRLATFEKPLFYRIYQFISRSFISLYPVRLECLPIAQSLLGGKLHIDVGSAVIFALPDDTRLTWDWHQETTYDPEMKDTVHFSFPIFEPATLDNGTMSVLPGSHNLGTLPYDKIQTSSDAATSLVPKGMDKIAKDYEEVHFTANVGDVAVFHNDLIHRSNSNTSGKPRITGLVRIASIDKLPNAASWIDGKVY